MSTGEYLQAGPSGETRPTLSGYGFEQRNSGNTGWSGILPAALLAHAASAISCNSQLLSDVLDPVGPQDAATMNYVDTHAGISNSPLWYKGTAATTDATPTNLLTAGRVLATSEVSLLEGTVIVKKSDLSIIATYRFSGSFLNTADTVTQIGDGSSTGATTVFEVGPPQLSVGTFAGSVAFVISGTTVQIQGTGVAASNYTWTARMRADVG